MKKNLTRSKTCIKYERPSIYQEKYIEIPEIITYTIDEVYYEEQDKKSKVERRLYLRSRM